MKPPEMANVTAQQYMETWIKQTNYPEVAVLMGTNTQTNVTRVRFYQKRFLLSQEVLPDIDVPSPFGCVHFTCPLTESSSCFYLLFISL